MDEAASEVKEAEASIKADQPAEAAEAARAAAEQLERLAEQVGGLKAKELADRLAKARDLAQETAKAERELAEGELAGPVEGRGRRPSSKDSPRTRRPSPTSSSGSRQTPSRKTARWPRRSTRRRRRTPRPRSSRPCARPPRRWPRAKGRSRPRTMAEASRARRPGPRPRSRPVASSCSRSSSSSSPPSGRRPRSRRPSNRPPTRPRRPRPRRRSPTWPRRSTRSSRAKARSARPPRRLAKAAQAGRRLELDRSRNAAAQGRPVHPADRLHQRRPRDLEGPPGQDPGIDPQRRPGRSRRRRPSGVQGEGRGLLPRALRRPEVIHVSVGQGSPCRLLVKAGQALPYEEDRPTGNFPMEWSRPNAIEFAAAVGLGAARPADAGPAGGPVARRAVARPGRAPGRRPWRSWSLILLDPVRTTETRIPGERPTAVYLVDGSRSMGLERPTTRLDRVGQRDRAGRSVDRRRADAEDRALSLRPNALGDSRPGEPPRAIDDESRLLRRPRAAALPVRRRPSRSASSSSPTAGLPSPSGLRGGGRGVQEARRADPRPAGRRRQRSRATSRSATWSSLATPRRGARSRSRSWSGAGGSPADAPRSRSGRPPAPTSARSRPCR